MKLVLRGLLLCAALLGVWFFAKDALWLESAPFETVSVNNALLDKPQTLGAFTVLLTNPANPQLVIRHQAAKQANFESVPGKAFVAAAKSEDVFHEARGMSTVKSKVLERCTQQIVDAMAQAGGELVLTGTLKCAQGPIGYRLAFKAGQAQDLLFDLTLQTTAAGLTDYNRTYLIAASKKDEGFYGFGEQYTFFNQKGRKLPILVSEQGVGRGVQPLTLGADLTNDGAGGKWHNSYAGVPHFITTESKSLMLDTHHYAVFDMRRDDAAVIELYSNHMFGRLIAGNNPLELIENYTAITGRMRALPEWVTKGAIIGLQGGTEKVRQTLAQLNKEQAPLGAFWLQDWVGQRITSFGKQLWWNWTVDKVRYPGWNELTADLKKQGIETMTYVNPFLVDVEDRKAEQGANYRNLYKEALDNGYLVMRKSGEPYLIKNTSFSAGLLDLTNPKAWTWMKEVIKKEVIAAGSLGWMADFGEGFPMDGVTFEKVDPLAHHNAYAELWAKLNREAIDEAGVGATATFFSRSGYTRSPQYSTLFWLGDQLVTWDHHDGLKTAVTGLLSSGISGYAFNHSDIGGYTTINSPIANYHRSKELQMRWAELSAFNVVYRTHQGNRPDDNWQFNSDEETLKHFVRMAKVYACWNPYRRELVAQASAKGLPVVRHPYLHYPQDMAFRNMDHAQFMVGSEFMVAPVVEPGASQVNVVLPQGDWVDLWSAKDVAAGSFSWPAPMGKPVVFYRKGSSAGQQTRACLAEQKLI
jgi:alpha-glucosidase